MVQRRLRGPSVLVALLLAAGCTTREPIRPATTGSTRASSMAASAATTTRQQSGVFSLSAAQARQVAVVVAFLDAYDAGRLSAALAAFAPDAVVSDCDYRAVENVNFHGRGEIAGWLRARMADHDRLIVARIYDENPEQPVGVVGVEYQRRTSDTLRALGFAAGIRPKGATKVVFTADDRIQRFANGPFGGSAELCQPG
jgi:hypothetical protein